MAKKAKPAKKNGPRRGLTLKQEAFCQHYALHGNATEAYRKAYATKAKPAVIHVEAQKLLNNPKVSLRLEALQNKVAEVIEKKFSMTAEDVLGEIAAIASYNAADYFTWGTFERPVWRKSKETGGIEKVLDKDGNQVVDLVPFARAKSSDQLSRDQMRAIMAVSETITKTGDRMLEVKMGDKLGALKLLGQHLGLFKIGVSGVDANGKVSGPLNVVLSSAEANL